MALCVCLTLYEYEVLVWFHIGIFCVTKDEMACTFAIQQSFGCLPFTSHNNELRPLKQNNKHLTENIFEDGERNNRLT